MLLLLLLLRLRARHQRERLRGRRRRFVIIFGRCCRRIDAEREHVDRMCDCGDVVCAPISNLWRENKQKTGHAPFVFVDNDVENDNDDDSDGDDDGDEDDDDDDDEIEGDGDEVEGDDNDDSVLRVTPSLVTLWFSGEASFRTCCRRRRTI